MSGFRAIEISFPSAVELTNADQQALVSLISEICRRYEANRPGRVMWPFGIGMKLLTNLMAHSDDEPLEFDEGVFSIECSEREDYDWKCAKCGRPQGDHSHCYMPDPPAGDCEFTVTNG